VAGKPEDDGEKFTKKIAVIINSTPSTGGGGELAGSRQLVALSEPTVALGTKNDPVGSFSKIAKIAGQATRRLTLAHYRMTLAQFVAIEQMLGISSANQS